MSLDSYTTEGSNLSLASGILGAFWTQVFPNNGLVSSVVENAKGTEDETEDLVRGFPGWLTGTVDGILRVDRLEVVPVDRAVQEPIRISDGTVGAGKIGMPSQKLNWLVRMSQTYKDVPFILPKDGDVLLQGLDYTVDGADIVFRENPTVLGVPFSMENIDGTPTACWVLYLPSCIPGDENVESNFSFYNAPPEARRALMDMLTQEGSLTRILRYMETCFGIKPPTVFEKRDESGDYTSIESTWVENGGIHGTTSGGEVISVPQGSPLLSGFNSDDNRLTPNSPMSSDVRVYGKYSDGDGAGIPAGDAFIPNKTQTLAAGETGAIDPSGDFDERLSTAVTAAGLSMTTELPAGSANPVERIYGLLGRNQPQVVSIKGVALESLSKNPHVLDAVTDSIPAGSLLVISQEESVSDTIDLDIEDSCEAFIVNEISEPAAMTVGESVNSPKGVALP